VLADLFELTKTTLTACAGRNPTSYSLHADPAGTDLSAQYSPIFSLNDAARLVIDPTSAEVVPYQLYEFYVWATQDDGTRGSKKVTVTFVEIVEEVVEEAAEEVIHLNESPDFQ